MHVDLFTGDVLSYPPVPEVKDNYAQEQFAHMLIIQTRMALVQSTSMPYPPLIHPDEIQMQLSPAVPDNCVTFRSLQLPCSRCTLSTSCRTQDEASMPDLIHKLPLNTSRSTDVISAGSEPASAAAHDLHVVGHEAATTSTPASLFRSNAPLSGRHLADGHRVRGPAEWRSVLQGLWRGTYGPHGIEVVHVTCDHTASNSAHEANSSSSRHSSSSGVDAVVAALHSDDGSNSVTAITSDDAVYEHAAIAPAVESCLEEELSSDSTGVLRVVKLTGDPNVPAGQLSLVIRLDQPLLSPAPGTVRLHVQPCLHVFVACKLSEQLLNGVWQLLNALWFLRQHARGWSSANACGSSIFQLCSPPKFTAQATCHVTGRNGLLFVVLLMLHVSGVPIAPRCQISCRPYSR